MTRSKYSLRIQWSDEDDCYVVVLPEWEGLVLMPVTDGKTYEEAAHKVEEVLEMLIVSQEQDGLPLPEPTIWTSPN